MPIKSYVVRGRVQGVGFRWSTERRAREIGLAGWVRNNPDGAVEIWVSGTDDQIADFEDWLKRGPALARVESVEKAEVQPEVELVKPFTIR